MFVPLASLLAGLALPSPALGPIPNPSGSHRGQASLFHDPNTPLCPLPEFRGFIQAVASKGGFFRSKKIIQMCRRVKGAGKGNGDLSLFPFNPPWIGNKPALVSE